MIGKLLRGTGRRHGLRLFAFYAGASLAATMSSMAPAAAQDASYFNQGLRWIGTAYTCTAPSNWTAEPLFHLRNLPAELASLCLYTWTPIVRGSAPAPAQVQELFTVSQAQEMTEDVPVLFPTALPSTEEEAFLAGLRNALRAQVGDLSLLPSLPARPGVRVVVIDSAPDARSGQVQPGASRHGDTLAHLIEDLVCKPVIDPKVARTCAAEVTTVLALPWIARGVPGSNGGYLGTLADLARAIERAVATWQNDKVTAPSSTPARLVLNLSLGWEHTPGIADCSTDPPGRMGPPARAVRQILQYAASQGALIVAAAGNDSGGPAPRTGLVCPGRYQRVPRDTDPSQALLVAVSGVDYQDRPLETARPHGITGIAGLGLGGVAWKPGDPVPPSLTGSSVATAVVSAVSALVWVDRPSWTATSVASAVYGGGIDAGAADDCPLLLGACRSHRVSVCGALAAAGASPGCSPPAPKPWSSPDLSAESATLAASASVPPSTGTVMTSVSVTALPRFMASTVQVDPSVFPQPISATCPTCRVAPNLTSTQPYAYLPARGQPLSSPVLVVRFPDGTLNAMGLGSGLGASTSYEFPLPASWVVQSAYLTGFETSGTSVTEQIFVQQ